MAVRYFEARARISEQQMTFPTWYEFFTGYEMQILILLPLYKNVRFACRHVVREQFYNFNVSPESKLNEMQFAEKKKNEKEITAYGSWQVTSVWVCVRCSASTKKKLSSIENDIAHGSYLTIMYV